MPQTKNRYKSATLNTHSNPFTDPKHGDNLDFYLACSHKDAYSSVRKNEVLMYTMDFENTREN